jgi:hypothetical protein
VAIIDSSLSEILDRAGFLGGLEGTLFNGELLSLAKVDDGSVAPPTKGKGSSPL